MNDNDQVEKTDKYCCRICFRGDSDQNDPLISPCKCSGSMKYIHYKCLKQCIETKITKKIGEGYTFVVWKNYECEICLSEYPKLFKYKHKIYNMVDLDINYNQYIIFDYTLYEDTKKRSYRKGIIVANINDDSEITIVCIC